MKTIMKLSLTLLLGRAAAGSVGMAVAAPAVVSIVSVPAVSLVGPGQDVVVPITVSPADGVVSMQFRIAYDSSRIVPTGVYKTAFTDAFDLVFNTPVPGDLRISLYGVSPLTGSGDAAWIVFRAVGPAGTSSNLVWLQHELNEDQIPSSASDGRVDIVAAQSTIRMPDDASGGSGAVAIVPVTANPADGYIGADLEIRWNASILDAQSVALGDLPPGWSVSSNLSTPGRAVIAVYGDTPLSGTRTLVTISYLVTGAVGDVTPLDVAVGSANEGNITTTLDDGLFTVDCNDANPCTDDSFDGMMCVHTGAAAGTPCGDPSSGPCDFPDTCNGMGSCQTNHAADGVSCGDAGTQCINQDTCLAGACHDNGTRPDGTVCNDGNSCTSNDVCSAGLCGGTPNPPPPEVNDSVTVRSIGPTTFIRWNDAPGVFNVYRGSRRSGLPWAYNQSCMATNVSVQSVPDLLRPPPGVTYYYLVTRKDACGESIPGRASNGDPIPNSNPCPASGSDQDNDGVFDKFDNCPDSPNPNQFDSDGDALGDVCDNCPLAFNPTQQDINDDGAGDACDPDIDGDGVLNGMDNCPFRANSGQSDGDGDSVGDVCDNCPAVANPDQRDSDFDGIGNACDPTP